MCTPISRNLSSFGPHKVAPCCEGICEDCLSYSLALLTGAYAECQLVNLGATVSFRSGQGRTSGATVVFREQYRSLPPTLFRNDAYWPIIPQISDSFCANVQLVSAMSNIYGLTSVAWNKPDLQFDLAQHSYFKFFNSPVRDLKPSSRAFLFSGVASGASPARMNPWPAPS